MNSDMVIKETNVWGQFYNVRNMIKRTRLMKKSKLITNMNSFPFIDHYTIYAYKPKNQRGAAREEQTFILSYAYNYDAYEDENAFINKLTEIGLSFYKEKCLYYNHDAYRIIIYENQLPIEELLQHIQTPAEITIHYMPLTSHSVDSTNASASSSLQCSYAKDTS
jgi:hypothetical protein